MESPSWNNHRSMDTEAVYRFVGKTQNHLKCVGRFCLCLKVDEGRRQARFIQLDLDQEPRFALFYYEEIHFAFLLIA